MLSVDSVIVVIIYVSIVSVSVVSVILWLSIGTIHSTTYIVTTTTYSV